MEPMNKTIYGNFPEISSHTASHLPWPHTYISSKKSYQA
tara:strand:- start:1 stop:117 length:117 start_codon:yes stop_codon:yes gene_type:complete